MREQLIQYVNLLFAGIRDCEDMKQEILQNTLDRYDDLIVDGKVPEAAYRLAISGIGDINEILGTASVCVRESSPAVNGESDENEEKRKRLRATAIGLYILCPIPLFIASEMGLATLGLCGLLVIVAVATVMIVFSSKSEKTEEPPRELTEREKQRKSVKSILNTLTLVIYFLFSFATQMWSITWLVFPVSAAVWQLVQAILDLKEANRNEI